MFIYSVGITLVITKQYNFHKIENMTSCVKPMFHHKYLVYSQRNGCLEKKNNLIYLDYGLNNFSIFYLMNEFNKTIIETGCK